MTRAAGLLLLTMMAVTAQPKFEDYPVTEVFKGTPAPPILTTAEQRMYRTRIRNGVATGAGVWTGSSGKPITERGPNFAGHFFVIRWGCGSDCLMMAIVDARTGEVHGPPPLSGIPRALYLPMDPMSGRDIDFQRQSSLMVLRNACKVDRSECGVYYFIWKNGRFNLVRRVLVDLTHGAALTLELVVAKANSPSGSIPIAWRRRRWPIAVARCAAQSA